MLTFTVRDIKEDCDPGSFNRGQEYFRKGKVVECTAKYNNKFEQLEIKGKVAGSFVYRQDIEVDQDENNIYIEGDCTCPVGYNCKHVVAVLLSYLESTAREADNNSIQSQKKIGRVEPIESWMDNFLEASFMPPENLLQDESEWIAYFVQAIRPGEKTGETIAISLARSGFKKKGGYKKPRKVSLDSEYYSSRYNYSKKHINPVDHKILALLQGTTDYFYGEPRLQGALGWQVLELMIKSGRCFYQSLDNGPLTIGKPAQVHFEWQDKPVEIGSQIKASRLLGNNFNSTHLLLPTEPAAFLDPARQTVEIIESSLNFLQLKMLTKMPPLAEDKLEATSIRLIEHGLDRFVPPPLPIDITDIDSAQPTPKAVLDSEIDPLGRTVLCMRLSFVYANLEVQLLDPDIACKRSQNGIERIVRNRPAENELISTIADLGFEIVGSLENPRQVLAIVSFSVPEQARIARWRRFLVEDRQDLEAKGWLIEIGSNFKLDFVDPADDWDVEITSENDWFSLKFDVRLGGHKEKLSLLPIVSQLLQEYPIDKLPSEIVVEAKAGVYVCLPKSKIEPVVRLMYELFDSVPEGQDSVRLSRFDALKLNEMDNHEALSLKWRGGTQLRNLGKKLANFDGIKQVLPAKTFKGQLRDYQQQGFNWLQFLREFEFGGVLADDMGLGKTVQTLVHLQKEKSARRLKQPCLIVAPTSLMSNWKREAGQFTPNLSVLVLQGAERKHYFDEINDHDLILTTYPLISRDYVVLSQHEFHYIVLDEAQNIKNPKASTTRFIKSLRAKHRLALTGTPMENHLGELWSIFDFLMPGFLGSEKLFNTRFRTPVEKYHEHEVSDMLAKRIKPFLLRRSKQLVAKELPAKTEIVKTVAFDSAQSTLYESIRISMEKKIRQLLASKGLNRSHITVLDALLKLRQVCCDPQLLKLPQAKKVKKSAKMELLMDMLPEMLEEGRKILIFSQFTTMLGLIEAQLATQNIKYTKLTGSTRKRDEAINRFTSGTVDVFLISLKAGGVGLNLTEADTIIHYDPWWNPAVENQASDRAHRIGQDKPVFVYKLVAENTLEEKILEMQQRKQQLADGVYGQKNAAKDLRLTAEDIEDLLSPLSSD